MQASSRRLLRAARIAITQPLHRIDPSLALLRRASAAVEIPPVSVLTVYRARNAATVVALREALPDGAALHAWSLDDVDPRLADVTVGVGAGSRFELLNRLLAAAQPPPGAWVVLSDDDVRFERGSLEDLLRGAGQFGLDVCQPAHAPRSHVAYRFNRARWVTTARRTTWVEQGPMVVFSPRGRRALLPLPEWIPWPGWGVETLWSRAREQGLVLGILDAVSVVHTNPVATGYDIAEADRLHCRLLTEAGASSVADLLHTERRFRAGGGRRRHPGDDLLTLLSAADAGGARPPVLSPGVAASLRAPASVQAAVRELPGYVLAPPVARTLLARALRRRGLLVGPALLHVPNVRSTQALRPLGPSRTPAAAAWGRTAGHPLGRMLLSSRAAAAAARALAPGVGMWVRSERCATPFDWLVGPAGADPALVRLDVSWRGARHGAVLRGWPAGAAAPTAFVKLAPAPAHSLVRETAALRTLGPAARSTGAAVPEALAEHALEGCTALVQSVIPGTPAAEVLHEAPDRLAEYLERLSAWLVCWNATTARSVRLDAARLRVTLLGPAAELAAELPAGDRYVHHLRTLLERVDGQDASLVAAHRDLTADNVLWAPGGQLGVVDWATACDGELPGADLVYAVVDAVHRAYAVDRATAFDACFARDGRAGDLWREHRSRLRAALGLAAEGEELALHACFVQHAANERRDEPRGPRPFLAVLARVARLTGAADET